MLVLSRKVGEKILIGDSISITVVRISGGGVRIGIEAPTDLPVVREELATELNDAEKSKAAKPAAVIHQETIVPTESENPFEGETPNQPR